MNIINTCLWSGAQLTMIPKFDDRKIWDLLLSDEDGLDINLFMAVPTVYQKLIQAYDRDGMSAKDRTIRRRLRQLRLMVSGSAALPVPVLDRWRKISGHTLLERYGMTETGMVLTNPYEPASDRIPSYVGKPFPGIDVAILDDNGEVHHDDSTEGELIIKSPSLFDRYLDNPEATEATFLN